MNFKKNIGKTSRGGAKTKHHKNTKDMETVFMPPPPRVYLPMKQHIGVALTPTIKVGERVLKGQIIGDSESPMSSPIHASVSGTIVEIGKIKMPSGDEVASVTIRSDDKQENYREEKTIQMFSKEDFIKTIRDSGVVGLGGAGFPTHLKYNTALKIDYLLVNGAECEPYITSDYREMIEYTEDIINGIKIIKQFLNIEKVYIGIEGNKPLAIKKLSDLLKSEKDIQVIPLRARYPQGAEKVIVYELTGRIIKEGKLPIDEGCIVTNITTVSSICKYIKTSQPLTSKRITVDGGALKEKKNVFVPIGTPVKDVINFCGGFIKEPEKLIFGGPMMGRHLNFDDYPITKTDNAIIAFDEKEANLGKQTNCIRCGKCAEACPLNLLPLAFERAFDAKDGKQLRDLKVQLCMECGTCSYVCPARRDLVGKIRSGKVFALKSLAKTREDK